MPVREALPATISARPCDIRSNVAKSSNILTGSAALIIEEELDILILLVACAIAPNTTVCACVVKCSW